MKNHKKSIVLVILLLLVAIATAYVGGTYAKYTAEVSGTGTATVAEWNFATDNAISDPINVSLSQTYHASTLVSGKIAPGTSGSFAIALKNTSEVGADFTVSLGTVTGKPTNLKFYKDAGFTSELTPGTDTITGQLIAEDSTGLTVNVYWKWEYETMSGSPSTSTAGDEADTTNGTTPSTLQVPVTITGVQTPPSSTAITSHIN